ncbi:tyrosyl-tRNA synthetase [Xylariaceae sp. FL0804]|nr:tyrosyl-tRNA synthetase [Xylariaceae sp. FL0804]
MATAALFRSPSGPRATLCRACLLRSRAANRQPSRSVGLKYLEKQRQAQERWDQRAVQIQNGEARGLWDELKERGFVKDIAGTDETISELMRVKRIGAYVGIDPTAPSLHLGHLLPLMALFWMYMHGYQAASVVGGATARVGDPTDRLTAREDMKKGELVMYLAKIHYQLKRLWVNVDVQARRYGYEKEHAWRRSITNNATWYSSTPITQVLKLFAGMRMGSMLSRDSYKRRMTEGDGGMSVAEFIYPLMQAYDWWHLYSGKLDIQMQIGGSDQYGNIVAGTDAIKYMRSRSGELEDSEESEDSEHSKVPIPIPDTLHRTPVGFTVPLLTDSSGAKFGKSAGNAVWLDPFMTNAFDLYGYFMRRPDDQVESLLKLFTFMPLDDIGKLMAKQNEDPKKRVAHHKLAYEVLCLVHSEKDAKDTQAAHLQMFSKEPVALREKDSQDDYDTAFYPAKNEPADVWKANKFRIDIQLPESLVMTGKIGRILHAAGLADSVSDGHRLAKGQGAYIGGAPGAMRNKEEDNVMTSDELKFTPVRQWFPQETLRYLIDGKLLILRRGKHFVRVVEVVSDEQWKASGQTYPGEPGTGKVRMLRNQLREAAGGKNLHFTEMELAEIMAAEQQVEDDEAERLRQLDELEEQKQQNPDDPNAIVKPLLRFPRPKTRAQRLLEQAAQMTEFRYTPPGNGNGNPEHVGHRKHPSAVTNAKTLAIDAVLRKRLDGVRRRAAGARREADDSTPEQEEDDETPTPGDDAFARIESAADAYAVKGPRRVGGWGRRGAGNRRDAVKNGVLPNSRWR